MVCYSEGRMQINKKYIQNFGMRKTASENGFGILRTTLKWDIEKYDLLQIWLWFFKFYVV